MEKLIIKHHKPLHTVALTILCLLIVIGLTWIILDEINWSYTIDRLEQTNQNQSLKATNGSMESEAIKLQQEMTILTGTNDLQERIIADLQRDVVEQQDNIYSLKSELTFYKSVMNPTGQPNGINIQGLHIKNTSQPNKYYLKLVLNHISKNDKVVSGKLKILLEGTKTGVVTTIDVQDIALSDLLPLTFKFSNFGLITGGILLPADFEAHKIIVHIEPADGTKKGNNKGSTIERTFDWLEVIEY